MSSNEEPAAAISMLSMLLDKDHMDVMLQQSPENLGTEEKESLQRLFHHFCTLRKNRSKLVGRRDGSMQPRRAASNNPFSRFLKLSSISILPDVASFIKEHGTDAALFLSFTGASLEPTEWSGEQAGDAFMSCYMNTIAIKSSIDISHVRWLFYMLLFYDICKLIRPETTCRRVGTVMMSDIQDFLQPLVRSQNVDIDAAVAASDVYEWCMYGSKINILASRFGPGCILALATHLSRDFLKKKITESGPYHEQAIFHLEHILDIESLLQQSRAGRLGRRVRQHLLRPFQECQKVRSSRGEDRT